jgi:hypothetical protein
LERAAPEWGYPLFFLKNVRIGFAGNFSGNLYILPARVRAGHNTIALEEAAIAAFRLRSH